MRKRTRSRSSFGFLAVTVASASAIVSLLTFGEAEAQAAPDPEAVRSYLMRLEAEQPAAPMAKPEKKQGGGEHLRKVVEGAAVRAPSGSLINGIEAALAEKLG